MVGCIGKTEGRASCGTPRHYSTNVIYDKLIKVDMNFCNGISSVMTIYDIMNGWR